MTSPEGFTSVRRETCFECLTVLENDAYYQSFIATSGRLSLQSFALTQSLVEVPFGKIRVFKTNTS